MKKLTRRIYLRAVLWMFSDIEVFHGSKLEMRKHISRRERRGANIGIQAIHRKVGEDCYLLFVL